MVCPRCGTPAIPGGAFCARCGLPLAAAPQTVMPIALPRQKSRKGVWLALLLVAGLLGLIAFGLSASGLLRFGAKGPEGNSLAGTGKGDGNSLVATGKGDGNSLQGSAQKPPGMPPEVWEWLEHLRITDERKEQIKAKQMAQLSSFLSVLQILGPAVDALNPDGSVGDDWRSPEEATSQKIEDLRPDWRELQSFFQSKAPPEECVPVAQSYDQALYEITGMAGDTVELLKNIQDNPQKGLQEAMGMQHKSYDKIDLQLVKTDDLVGAICGKYDVRKWFSIKSDIGGGSLGKFSVNPPVR